MIDKSLEPFFRPLGVVVVGVSTHTTKLGFGVARNLVNSGYKGAIHFVSQKPGNLFGRPIYASIAEVPDPVNLAVLIVPAPDVPAILRACGARKVKAAIVVSSGFRESGPEGAKLEAEVQRIAKEDQIRIIGPNCIGLLDTHIPLDTTFLPPPTPRSGDVAFISQSGAICAAIIDWSRGQGFGFSRLISLGNQMDVNETDMLAAVADDEHTRVLTLYIENIDDEKRFVEQALRVSQRKPIIALKVGKSVAGQRAAYSHTGALAGSDEAYSAAFERAGIFRAATSEEMFHWASALATCPLPKGRRVAILTNAGGPGVIAADALENHNLQMAGLTSSTIQTLSRLVPSAASLLNPVDMTAGASPEIYSACLVALLSDSGVDSVLVILPPPPMYTAEDIVDSFIPIIHESDKPVVVVLMGDQLILKAAEHLREARIPDYRFPEQAASALAILAQRFENLQAKIWQKPKTIKIPKSSRQAARAVLSDVSMGTWLDATLVNRLLSAYSISTIPIKLARNANEAAALSLEIGFPVVMKIASPDVLHKSDVGGVVLGIEDPQTAMEVFEEVVSHTKTLQPDARIEGLYIQRQVLEGQEVIVGVKRDEQFGPLVMFGSGGVEVEGLKDVSFSLAPLSANALEKMLSRTWAGRKLMGYRSHKPADVEALKDVLLRLAKISGDFLEIAEIEINPLRVLAPGHGAVAIDARIRVDRI